MSRVSDLKAGFLALSREDFDQVALVAGVPKTVIAIGQHDLEGAREYAWALIANDSEAIGLVDNMISGSTSSQARVTEAALAKIAEERTKAPPKPAPASAPLATPKPPPAKPVEEGVDLKRVYGTSWRQGSMH